MKAFVTGGTGFIGRVLVQKLIDRGDEVVALARSDSGIAGLEAVGARVVRGDITDVASMREGMEGCDVVFHLAGWYKLGAADWWQAETINVGGTRKVLRLAHELGIPRIVYASTLAIYGDTGGELVDESHQGSPPFLTEYDRTKWLAHYKVALPMIEQGAPVIVVMPGGVYGPGDTSIIGQMMEAFYKGQTPILPGPETTLTYAHVEDVAEGFILAAEKGVPGESYILAGPAIPLGEMIDFWAQLTGKRAPLLRIPADLVKPLAPVVGFVEQILPLPSMYSRDATATLGATYTGRADKARAELGWETRSLQAGMAETFRHIAAMPPEPSANPADEPAVKAALFAAAALFVLWRLGRRRAR